ncbi:hypothetical protein SAY86_002752 [Trapa natans]|uniref:AP2/ERF domain-containing protein n=1 Tax=Trapa natans TaxID=22666 RepID=A0AAN7R523_TRANT|nr:hypothetical protein SAY86_002752 [Trapa natans]
MVYIPQSRKISQLRRSISLVRSALLCSLRCRRRRRVDLKIGKSLMVKTAEESPASAVAAAGLVGGSSSSCKYKGVRKRKWGKWVSEIRLPNSRERIWLGSYDSAEKAARAFDAALFCLRGRSAHFNFPDSPPDIAGARSLSHSEIQAAAARFANSAPSFSPAQAHSEDSDHCPSPSSDGGTAQMDCDFTSLDTINGSYWDILTTTTTNCNSCSTTINNSNAMEFDCYYPSEYGIYQGYDELSSDYLVPTMPPPDYLAEENFDQSLWNF